MATQISNSEPESWPMEPNSPVGVDEHILEQVIAEGSLDFDEWTLLLSEIENTFRHDIEKIRLVYDAFLAEFPLCYGYWMKYADHEARLCTADKVVEVFERATQAATYSVDVWLQYCCFSISAFEDPHNVRRLFKRALSFVGKDYLCHTLWDKYLEFEFSQQRWSSLAHVYIQTLRFPSKRLHNYYDSFKKLAAAWKEEFDCRNSATELQSDLVLESGVPKYFRDDEISAVIKELLEPSVGLAKSKAVQKYVLIGEHIYKEACQLDEKIHCFETCIRRPYFHVKPLDGNQLENWRDYLNFAEKQGDFDWVVKLYERCLIPCANYPEFWMRYVDFMESKGGREIANFALARATQIFLKRMPMVHLFSAQYKEQIGDVCAARAAFLGCDTEADSTFVENVTIKANMEKRLGNFLAACNVFKEALETAAEKKKLHILPILYVRFSRLQYMTTDSADAARDILIDGIKHVPHCKLLLEELIKFVMMHGGSRHLNVVDSVIANALYSGPDVLDAFSQKDVEDVSSLYLQFVDLCGTIHDVRKAWNRHIKLFPHSVRTAYEHPAAGTKPLKSFMEGRLKSIVALPPRTSGSDHSIQSPSQGKKLSPPENYDSHSDHDATAPLLEQKSPLLENHDIQSDAAARIDQHHSGETDNSIQEKMQQVSPEVREQHREDICEPIVASLDLVHQVAAETEAKASLEFSKDDDVQDQSDHESKEDMKPLSVERLSLDPQENQSPSSVCATSHECEAQETSLSHESNLKSEALQENSTSNGDMQLGDQNTNGSHLLSSSMSTQVSDSSQIQTETVGPSSVACHQNFVKEEPLQPQKPMNSGRNWRQKHNNDRIHRDSRFGFRGHSHKRQHQQQRVSPQQYPRAEPHAQMPTNRGYPSQPLPSQNPQVEQGSQAPSDYPASANLTAPQAWPIQNMQQQNFSSASQVPAQPVAYAEAQMSQFPMQSHEQQGHVQGNQAYNQMWQYYYYQQQQQQQFLLQQQHLQQVHQQQPHQQQQYQAQQYFQQQQQLPHVQQPLQIQQPHFLQQQPYQQQLPQHLLYLQPQQQMQYQQVQQQQQQPPHQQQQEQEQRQPEHQNTRLQIDARSQNSSEQGVGVAPPYSTGASGTVTSAASPNPQHQSPLSL